MSRPQPLGISRRALLQNAACGFGYLAFAGLAAQAAEAEAKANPLAPKAPHLLARAKRVIFMFMHGGPSQVDTFDYKPTLAKYSGESAPWAKRPARLRPPPWEFARHGECGRWVSELFPNVARHVDDLCVINSMVGVHGLNRPLWSGGL